MLVQNATDQKVKEMSSYQPRTEVEQVTTQQHFWFKLRGYGNIIFHKGILVLLMGQSVVGLYEATRFMLSDFPTLEHEFVSGEITLTHLNEAIAEPLISLVGTSILIVLIVRLSLVKRETAEFIDVFLAIFFLIFNPYIIEYLVSLHFIDIGIFLQ